MVDGWAGPVSTSKARNLMASQTNQPDLPPAQWFCERNSTIHGRGAFASVQIPQGTLVLQERPLFLLCENEYEYPQMAIQDPRWNHWLGLVLSEQTHDFDRGPFYNRFRATSLRCGIMERGNQKFSVSGAFLQAARFNSSCQPNVHAHWDPNEGQMCLRAMREINPPEELLISYDTRTLLFPKADRQERLYESFRFICNCLVCASHSPSSDERRARLRVKINGVDPTDLIPIEDRIRETKDAIEILQDEGLYHFRDTLQYDLYRIYRTIRDTNNAMLYLQKAVHWACIMIGDRDQRVLDMDARLLSRR